MALIKVLLSGVPDMFQGRRPALLEVSEEQLRCTCQPQQTLLTCISQH